MASLSQLSPAKEALRQKVAAFVRDHCQPAEKEYDAHMEGRIGAARWSPDAIPPCMDRLKETAKRMGLWNLFVPPHLVQNVPLSHLRPSIPLTYREYGIMCEEMGRSFLASEACNCNAPDTGNMEVLLHHGTVQQKEQYLLPLLQGKIRSAFLMTEPEVASSDATNIETTLTRMENNGTVEYVLNGRKWWSTGAMDPRCTVALVLARMDYSHPSCTVRPGKGIGGPKHRHGAHTGELKVCPLTETQQLFGRLDPHHSLSLSNDQSIDRTTQCIMTHHNYCTLNITHTRKQSS